MGGRRLGPMLGIIFCKCLKLQVITRFFRLFRRKYEKNCIGTNYFVVFFCGIVCAVSTEALDRMSKSWELELLITVISLNRDDSRNACIGSYGLQPFHFEFRSCTLVQRRPSGNHFRNYVITKLTKFVFV